MNYEGAKDIKGLYLKLSGRYLHPIIRPRPDPEPPFITITDGMNTNITIERGDDLFGWKVSGEIQGEDVEFSSSGDRELIMEIDDRLEGAGLRNKYLKGDTHA